MEIKHEQRYAPIQYLSLIHIYADELKMFYTARRKLTEEFPDGKVDMKQLSDEYDELEQAHNSKSYGSQNRAG